MGMDERSWNDFSNAATVLSFLGFGVLSTAASIISPSCRSWIANSYSTETKMANLRMSLEKCRVLLTGLKNEDRLLRKVLDRKYPGFVAAFELHVMRFARDFRDLEAALKDNGKAFPQNWRDWKLKLNAIGDLQKEIEEISDDRTRTSSLMAHTKAYRKLLPLFEDLLRTYNDISPEQLDRKLDEVMRTLPQEDFEVNDSALTSRARATEGPAHVDVSRPPGRAVTRFGTAPEVSMERTRMIPLMPYTIV